MQKRYILLVLVIVFAVFLYTGNRTTQQTIVIDNCSATFYDFPITVVSPQCPNNSACIAEPYAQQNNAVVDVVFCACDKAKTLSYSDNELNGKIERLVASFYGYSAQANEICDQPVVLTKRSYG